MNKTTDFLFRVGLIAKGLDSLFEVIGGILHCVPTKLARYIYVFSEHEAFRHHHALAGKLDNLADSIEVHASIGEAMYLLIHGLAKVILILAIFRNKRWGYSGFVVVLSIFTSIEIVRAITAREIVTGLLGVFDMAVVVLIFKEYRARFGPTSVGRIKL